MVVALPILCQADDVAVAAYVYGFDFKRDAACCGVARASHPVGC